MLRAVTCVTCFSQGNTPMYVKETYSGFSVFPYVVYKYRYDRGDKVTKSKKKVDR